MTEKTVFAFDVGTRNLACCVGRVSPGGVTRVVHWDVHDIADANKTATLSRLFEMLDDLLDTLDDCTGALVMVENQPSRTSGMLKCVQHGIVSYFAMRNYQRGERFVVKEVSPRIKLDGRTAVRAKSYKDRKAASVRCVTEIICSNATLATRMNDHRKKDDLADAFLYLATSRMTGFTMLHPSPSAHLQIADVVGTQCCLLSDDDHDGSTNREEDGRED